MQAGRRAFAALMMAGALALAACDMPAPSVSPAPEPRPAAPAPAAPPEPAQQSQRSKDLATYYARLQNDLQVRGLLRTDGGGPDTPYTSSMLARNFQQIVFFDEYAGASSFAASNGAAGRLRRWDGPVRFGVEFGAFVSDSQKARDTALVQSYATRLARATGHPIGVSNSSANFHVLFMGEDDAALIRSRVQQLVPNIDRSALRLFTNLPREIHCLVVAFSAAPGSASYGKAVALIRAEHPDLMRRSCVHEELAQGLGLANDSPAARPSIFNDDDEFALLTTHDTHLLGMLYDSRIATGISLPAARGIIGKMAAERTGAGG